jgi:PAS domain S-box-containing protein
MPEAPLTERIEGLCSRLAEYTDGDASSPVKQALDLLMEAQSELARANSVIENISESLTVSDATGSVIHRNKASFELHGLGDEFDRRMPLTQYFESFELRRMDGELVPLAEWPMVKALAGASVSPTEYVVRRKDSGSEKIVSYAANPVRDSSGRIAAAVLTGRDVTADRAAQQERERLLSWVQGSAEALNWANERLREQAAELRQQTERLERQSDELQSQNGRLTALAKELQQAHDQLEARVSERTHELALRNSELRNEVLERRRSEAALLQSEQRFRAIFENSAVGIFLLDPSLRLIRANPTMLKILGWSAQESEHLLLSEIVHPLDYAAFSEQLRVLFSGGLSSFPREVRLAGQGGRLLWALTSVSAVLEAGFCIAVVEDITERRRGEETLRRHSLTFENLYDAVLITDLLGRIVDLNPAAEQMFGYQRDEVLGKSPPLFEGGAGEVPFTRQVSDEVQRLGRWSGEVVFRRKDGTTGICAKVVVPLRDEMGVIIANIGVTRDVTLRKQSEKALSEYTDRLRVLHDIDLAVLSAQSTAEVSQVALDQMRQLIPYESAEVSVFTLEGMPRIVAAVNGRIVGEQESIQLPCVTQGSRVGSLTLTMSSPGSITVEQLGFARQVADSLAIAIQSTQLYEAEQQARQVAEALRSANLSLTQSLELAAVLDQLMNNLALLVPFDAASVSLLDANDRLRLEAWRGREEVETGTLFDITANQVIESVLLSGESHIVPDVYAIEGWSDVLPNVRHASWMGVPFVAAGKTIGLCELQALHPGFYTVQHSRLAEALAAQAAMAIHNAQLYQQVRRGRVQLQSLSRRLVQVQEAERGYIARSLHDEAGQILSSMLVGLRLLDRESSDPLAVTARAADLRAQGDKVLEGIHSLATELRPVSLEHLGLVPALRQYTEAFERQHGIHCHFDSFGLSEERFTPEIEIALYRIVQEALTNVARHAHASVVDVLVERRGEHIVTIIGDNGIGFEPSLDAGEGRYGLFSMRERAAILEGRLTVESAPGRGTTVYVEVPHVHSSPNR